MKIYSTIATLIFSSLLLVSSASAAPGKKICLDPDTGQIRVKRNCTGFTTRELSGHNLVLGQIVKLSADENGNIRSSSDHLLGPINHISAGYYVVSTNISDLNLCVLTAAQNLKSDSSGFPESSVLVYPSVADPTKFRVELDTSGAMADMAFSVIAHCP